MYRFKINITKYLTKSIIGSMRILINRAITKGIIIGLVKLRVKATATKARINNEAVINLLFSKLL